MTVDEVRDLFAYNSWANARVLTALESLSFAEREAPVVSSFPSVRATLSHIVGAEWVWLRRWRGESPTTPPDWAKRPDIAELKTQLAAVEKERRDYLARLTDCDLEQPLSYRTMGSEPHSDVLGGLLRHVVNHSSYHRGQIATQLRQLGRMPPNTDLIAYLRQTK